MDRVGAPAPIESQRKAARRFARRVLISAAVVAPLAALVLPASAADSTPPPFRVVVHPDNPISGVNRAFLERAFLKNIHEWADGQALRPVDLSADSPARRAFSRVVLKRSVEAVKSYWQQRIFSGRGVPPPELATDAAVVKYVAQHRGAVGYVGSGADLGRVRVVVVH